MIDLHISCIAYGCINGNSIMCSVGSIGQKISIGPDNGLVLNRWQAIIWVNDGTLHSRVYVSLSFDELNASDSHHGAA